MTTSAELLRKYSNILSEEPAVVAATGSASVGQDPAAGQTMAPSPAQAAQMQAQAAQDQMKKKQDLQQAIRDKEQELIALRKELATINSPATVT
jgi:multidrug efflux pump subunit AcrA (membrane-fusion protein)